MEMWKTTILAAISALALGLAACEQEGPVEQTGEQIGEATEETAEQMEQAGEQAGEQIEQGVER